MKYLKIKDNIALKELEKYGFKAITIVDKTRYQYTEIIGNCEIFNIKIDCDNSIRFNQETTYNWIPGVIYDLIKNHIVEVVEE